MPIEPTNGNASERGASIAKLIAVSEVLTHVLTSAGVSPAVLLECLYYASNEDDLLTIIRLAVALDPQQRTKAVEMLWAMLEAAEPSAP